MDPSSPQSRQVRPLNQMEPMGLNRTRRRQKNLQGEERKFGNK